MKKVLVSGLIFLFLSIFLFPISNVFAVHVNGYYRSNGTYVNSYERTAPDGNPYNNYSYPGNYNPNTGSITGGNPDTYLNNYYDNSSSGSSYSYPSYTYPTTPSCPSMSTYDSLTDNCKCYSGYIVSGSSCVNASLYCSSKLGLMSQYNSSSKQCECMAGYVYSGSSCVSYSQACQKTYGVGSYGDKDYCYCSAGYEWNNSSKTACVIKPIKTENESCQDTYGINSYSPSTGKCQCNAGYVWNSGRTACMVYVNNFPAGCTSNVGFSPTTGMSCDGMNRCSDGMRLNSSKNECIPIPIVVSPKKIEPKLSISTISTKSEVKTPNVVKVEKKNEVSPPINTETAVNQEPVKKVLWYKRLFNWLF